MDSLITVKTTKSELDGITAPTSISKLTNEQQKAIFMLYRNIIADGFHAIYEKSIKELLESFINNVCKGTFDPTIPVRLNSSLEIATNTRKLISFFSTNTQASLAKIYHQVVYFLNQAENFTGNGQYDEAAMALIATGTCARNLNLSKQNPTKKGSVMQDLTNLRQSIAHIYAVGYSKEQIVTQLQSLVSTSSSFSYNSIITTIKSKASTIRITIDENSISTYSRKIPISGASSSSGDESPRAFTFKP